MMSSVEGGNRSSTTHRVRSSKTRLKPSPGTIQNLPASIAAKTCAANSSGGRDAPRYSPASMISG